MTPNKTGVGPNGLPSGFMQAKFQTSGPLNFGTYSYVVMFNTTGTNQTPIAYGFSNGYAGYSFFIAIEQSTGGPTLSIYQGITQGPNTAPLFQKVPFVTGNDAYYTLNSNGQNTQFSVQFRRALASAFLQTSPTPSASATPTATPTPSSSPSPTPTGSATPAPGTGQVWYFNYFVVQGPAASVASQLVDSLGNSPSPQKDTVFSSQPLDTSMPFDTGLFYPLPSQAHGSNGDPSSIIYAGEISNSP